MDIKLETSWKNALQAEFQKPYFLALIEFVKNEYKVFPKAIFPEGKYIFRALNACPIDNVKVVIIGQDPYPTKGHAHGLCFSVEQNVRPFPKSLQNIFKEIQADLGHEFPENGSLLRWTEQGVLLINSVLTVHEGVPDSHARKGWEQFTDALIDVLQQRKKGIVYMLWGSKAQQKAQFVNSNENLILQSVHPSPLSAYRGFFGCKHFSKANDYLISLGKKPILW